MPHPRTAPGTPRQTLAFALAVALVLLLVACGGSGPAAVAACTTDPECGGGAYCQLGACHASSAPVAGITLPPLLDSARELTFGAAVTDVDPGDSVAGHAWTVTLVSGACEAEPGPTTAATLQVVFWCAGTYDVTLVATDAHGVASAPATRRLEVAQSANLPTVTAALSTLARGHRCTGQPLACTLELPVDLRSAASDPSGGALTTSWRARPLNPLVTDAVVTFAPSASAADATVRISSPGTAIAGDWVFEVRVANAAGYLARASVTHHVENRPPEISTVPLTLEHRYQGGTYQAAGALVADAVDPDGDPVALSASYAEPAASGCVATFEPSTSAFSLSCPQPAGLIGGVTRELAVTAVDVNGDASQASAAVEILNRPPTIRLASGAAAIEIAVDHGNGPCLDGVGACFRADGVQPFAGEDPDGDPVSPAVLTALVDASATHSSGRATSGPAATFAFSTPHAFPGEFRAADGAGPFAVRGVVADPFGATATGEAPLRVGNRLPAVTAPAAFVAVDHRYDPVRGEYVATADLAAFGDPDGDPLTFSGDGPPGCAEFAAGLAPGTVAVTCHRLYRPGAGDLPPLAAFLGTRAVVARVDDAWGGASAPSSVTILDRPPTLASSSGPLVGRCACVCPTVRSLLAGRAAWPLAALLDAAPGDAAAPATCTECTFAPVELTVDPGAADPDGDPLQLTFRRDGLVAVTRTALPAEAPLLTDWAFPASWEITATDGSGLPGPPATATVEVTEVACP